MKKVFYSAVVLILVGGAACNKWKSSAESNNPAPNGGDGKTHVKKTEGVSYANDVKPFFTTYCIECHNGDKMAKAGYNFDNFETLMKGGRKGPAVVPGEPDKSAVVRALSGQGKRMPPSKYKNQPKPEDVDMVKAWIAAGAKDDSAKGE